MPHFARWKTILIWLAVLAGVLLALPNALGGSQRTALPGWFPSAPVKRGLDLSGGAHVELRLERADVVRARLQALIDDVGSALRGANIRYTGLTGTGRAAEVRVGDPSRLDAARAALQAIARAEPVRGAARATLVDSGDGLLRLALTDEAIAHGLSQALAQAVDVVRRRVEQIGAAEARVDRQGADRIVVDAPGFEDAERLKYMLNQRGRLALRLVDTSMPVQQAIDDAPPATAEVLYSADDPPIAYLVDKRAVASGADFAAVEPVTDPAGGEAAVSFRLDREATQRFGEATRRNVGRSLAIVLDDQIIAVPAIRAPIVTGTGRISGDFDAQAAGDLTTILRTGALPAALTVVEERTVSLEAGADAVDAGLDAALVALSVVALFMLAFYGLTFGAVAIGALVVNLVLILAVLSVTGAVLTLPGIAGIVLTVGIAVDSNVLLYERIREEAKAGRSLPEAVSAGFSRAFAAIVDANITMLIAAALLFYMGSGPVSGFAVTVATGVATTVFTTFTLTRWLIARWAAGRRTPTLPRDIRAGLFDDTSIHFMSIRNYVFAATAALSIGAVLLLGTLGMNLGIDFSGGAIVEVKAKRGDTDVADIASRLGELNLGEVAVRDLGAREGALVRVLAQGGGENAEQTAAIFIRDELGEDYDLRRVEVVGPSVSGELAWAATIAVLTALAAILVYIAARFEWRFAVGAIVATMHDVLLTLGLFAVTGMEFTLLSIAAVLTVVCYSLNDTVVVYDRIRENLRHYRKMPLPLLIDASINQTLSRTVLTSATTLLALTALSLFGAAAIGSFALAMLFGVAVGTFSSIYIAGPVLILFKLRPERFHGTGPRPSSGEAPGAHA
ncbi:protein translocase subunit SecD [Rhizobium sp. TRM95111]|uniref:protein translocase subunit SecD n=1 Tax=Rhizobium alarense TaxID=2846851 RepID=UPI001F327762|nr:protein translocase subunit SecD [Rhizobium alarense]MCF3642116.1 protein translocase subunit SecD [Rhizobium alarense]